MYDIIWFSKYEQKIEKQTQTKAGEQKNIAVILQVSWVCVVCQKKQEMLTKTGNWFGSLTSSSEKPKTNHSDSLGSDFRAITTEEDKRAMKRQGSLQRSDPARGGGRRKDGNRFRRPSVSDEEMDDTPPGSPACLSDDELYRPDENRVRRKVVKFKGHEEVDHAPQGRHPGAMQNRPGPMNQGPGRGLVIPGQGPGIRPGQPQPQPQGLGLRHGAPQGRGMQMPGSQPSMQPNMPHQQPGSGFTPVGHPGTSPSGRAGFSGPQQPSPRGGLPPGQPRPGFGGKGPSGPQQQRFQAPQQNTAGYGRGIPPGSHPGPPGQQQGLPGQSRQHGAPGQPGYGRGGPTRSQPTTQYNLGPRPGAYGPSGPRPQAGFPPNHAGGPQAPGSPRPGDRMGPHQGARMGGPPGITQMGQVQMGPRLGPGGQPRHGMPVDQQGGQHHHPGQLGSPRQTQAPGQLGSPRPGQVSGQLGSPRQGQAPGQFGAPRPGVPLGQQQKGQVGAPRAGPPVEQSRPPVTMGSPRLGTPRNQSGTPQQGPFPGQVQGHKDTSPNQTRAQSGPSPQDPGLGHPRGPFGSQQQGPPIDQPKGQYGSSQQVPVMDQGRPRFGSAERGPMGDEPRRQQVPDARNGYSPDSQSSEFRR